MSANRSGAPGQESAARKANSEAIVNATGDYAVRDVLIAEIVELGPDHLYAASIGWRLGRLDAEEVAKEMVSEAGREAAASPQWRATIRRPAWVELQRRRGECARRHRLDNCTCPSGGAR